MMTANEKSMLPLVRIAPAGKESNMLALGCWVFGGGQWGGQDDTDSRQVMETALEGGITHFDTAAGYGCSEEIVGKFLAVNDRRDKVFLATKGNVSQRAEGKEILRSVEESLKRLRTDYIDIYYLHWPRAGIDMRPVLAALEKAREQSKIRAIGVSNFSTKQMQQVSEVARINAHQLCYNLLWRRSEEDVIPYCVEHDIAVVTYSSIAQGILTGKFPRLPQFPEDDSRAMMVMFREDVWPHIYAGVEKLKSLASEAGRLLAHLAIRWVAARPFITSILVGARKEGRAACISERARPSVGELEWCHDGEEPGLLLGT